MFLTAWFYNDRNILLITYLIHVHFIEWFDLISNSNNLFEILPINDFLDVFSMCLFILFMVLKTLKSFSSGLILINSIFQSL